MATIMYGTDSGAFDPLQATVQPEYSEGAANEDPANTAIYQPDAQAKLDQKMAEIRNKLAGKVAPAKPKAKTKPKVTVGSDKLPEGVPDFVEDPEPAEFSAEDYVEPKAEPEVKAEPELEPDPEAPQPKGRQVRNLLAKEKALREERAALQKERSEMEAQIAEFRRASEFAKEDPVAVLRALGVSGDDFTTVADHALNESLGDLAPEDYRREQAQLRQQRELAQAKQELERIRTANQERDLQEYWNTMDSALSSLDGEQYPVVDRLVEAYGDQKVSEEIRLTVRRFAQAGIVATPEQCLRHLEDAYRPLVQGVQPQSNEPAKPKARAGNKKSLRNNLQQTAPRGRSLEDLTPEQQNAVFRERFRAALRGGAD